MTIPGLIKQLYAIQAIQKGEFTLKSGQKSSVYVDLRQIVSHPDVLHSVADLLWQKIHHVEADLICGVPYTALPIATAISLLYNIPMVMVRKESKDYGTKKMVEGYFEAGQRCILIEDVVTTGSSIITTINHLKDVGIVTTQVAALVDREQGGREALKEIGCEFTSVCTLKEILAHNA
ncbi:MAG: orotate phosphoribosyltransferase [Gammaproteobacteria bacterium]